MPEPTIVERAEAWRKRYGHHLTLCKAWNWEFRDGSNHPALVRKGRDYVYPLTIETGKPCTCGMDREFWDLINEAAGAGTVIG